MIKKLWQAIWDFFNPKERPAVVEIDKGDCQVLLTRGWANATIVKKNKLTVWVRLSDWNTIIRRNNLVRYYV